MITINELDKSVTVVNADADYVIVDGQLFKLTDGEIFLSNLPSFYDVEVVQIVESNYIPRPEPEVIPEVIPDEQEEI